MVKLYLTVSVSTGVSLFVAIISKLVEERTPNDTGIIETLHCVPLLLGVKVT